MVLEAVDNLNKVVLPLFTSKSPIASKLLGSQTDKQHGQHRLKAPHDPKVKHRLIDYCIKHVPLDIGLHQQVP